MNATVTIEKITPQQAAELLLTNIERQRPKKQTHIDKLVAEMVSGRFLLACDAILLIKGCLANGQHRLSAAVKSGKTCQFIVLRTNDESIYDVIDTGVKRSIADVILMPHGKNVAAIARLVCEYDSKSLTTLGNRSNNPDAQITRSRVLDYIRANEDALVDAATTAHKLYVDKPIIPVRMAGALVHIGRRVNEAVADSFIKAAYSGDSRGDSARDLHERMLKNKISKAKLPGSYMFGLMVKALRSQLLGTRPGVLKLHEGEDFPTLEFANGKIAA